MMKNLEYVETITNLGMEASMLKKKLLEQGVPEEEWNKQIVENISVNAAFELFLQGYDFDEVVHDLLEAAKFFDVMVGHMENLGIV